MHAALQDWEIEAMDVKLAYLHGVLEEEIYMEQPEGFIAKGEEDKVCKLVRSLYRLKQAGWVWNRTFAHTIKRKLGFDTIHSDVVICLGCNKDLWSQRSKYKSYGALRGCDLGVRDCLQVYCGK